MDEVTMAEAAELVGVSRGRIRQLVAARTLPERRRVGNVVLLDRADVDRYAARERKPGWPKGRPRKADASGDVA